jgi:hypothetical protein
LILFGKDLIRNVSAQALIRLAWAGLQQTISRVIPKHFSITNIATQCIDTLVAADVHHFED